MPCWFFIQETPSGIALYLAHCCYGNVPNYPLLSFRLLPWTRDNIPASAFDPCFGQAPTRPTEITLENSSLINWKFKDRKWPEPRTILDADVQWKQSHSKSLRLRINEKTGISKIKHGLSSLFHLSIFCQYFTQLFHKRGWEMQY